MVFCFEIYYFVGLIENHWIPTLENVRYRMYEVQTIYAPWLFTYEIMILATDCYTLNFSELAYISRHSKQISGPTAQTDSVAYIPFSVSGVTFTDSISIS